MILILSWIFQSLSRKLSKRGSGGLPASLRRKLSAPPEERDASTKEEVLEGTGSMNYLLNADGGGDDGM